MTEIRKAREVEKREKRRKLFPIRLTDFETLRDWTFIDTKTGVDLAEEVRGYAMPNDFSNWKNHDAFEKEFARLEKDLRASIGKRREKLWVAPASGGFNSASRRIGLAG